MNEFNFDTITKIIDNAITESHSILVLESPEGTQDVTVSGLSGSGVLQFFFVLQAIKTILAQLRTELEIDAASPEWSETVDTLLALVKSELIARGGDTDG